MSDNGKVARQGRGKNVVDLIKRQVCINSKKPAVAFAPTCLFSVVSLYLGQINVYAI